MVEAGDQRKARGIVGWIAIGLLAAVTGEHIMPGRNPGGMTVTLLVGVTGALLGLFLAGVVAGAGATEFGTPSILLGHPWSARAAGALPAEREPAPNVSGDRRVTTSNHTAPEDEGV
jgi:uncharacterized membrane protein YeaQ/YmgE (transglycosylase-associated protein family)